MNNTILENENSNESSKRTVNTYFIDQCEDLTCLEKLGTVALFPKNHVFIEREQIVECCYVLKKGRVVSYEKSGEGKERIYHFYEKNTVFLESEIICNEKAQLCYRAGTECEVVCIERNVLIEAYISDLRIRQLVLESVSYKLHSLEKQIVKVHGRTAEYMVCEFLISLGSIYRKEEENTIYIQEKISQKVIAEIVGLNRITVVKIVKALKEKGYLSDLHGRIGIMDFDGLREYQKKIIKKRFFN